MSAYFIHILILICIQLILAISLQLAFGYTGLFTLGHIAFYGIGAYTSALLALAGLPFTVCFFAAGVVASVFGYLLSTITSKLKGDYLALVTMGFVFVVYTILQNWTSLTHGPMGLPGIPKPSFFGFSLDNNFKFLILASIIALVSYLILNKTVTSPFGRVLESIRDDELAAKTLGKNIFRLKSYSLAISAFFTGIAGSLYAHYISFIDPSSFVLMQLVPILTIIIIGGLASMRGAVIATFILVIIPEALRFVGLPSSIVGPGRQILYSLLLILILLYRPMGFYGKVELK